MGWTQTIKDDWNRCREPRGDRPYKQAQPLQLSTIVLFVIWIGLLLFIAWLGYRGPHDLPF